MPLKMLNVLKDKRAGLVVFNDVRDLEKQISLSFILESVFFSQAQLL